MKVKKINAVLFKKQCLKYLELTFERNETIIITKNDKPIAKLIPYDTNVPPLFGRMRGTVTINGDIIKPIDTEWEANE